MPVVPRYESSQKYPSARSAGFLKLDADNLICIGMSPEQIGALLSRQDPSANCDFKIGEADMKSASGETWQTITGEPMSDKQKRDATKVGVHRVSGKNASFLIDRVVDVYSHLRVGTMAMVLIDWE